MIHHGLWLSIAYPLLGVAALLIRRPTHADRLSDWFLRTAPIPAVVAAIWVPVGDSLDFPWLLLGSRFLIDEITQIFLLFTSLLWLLAGWYGTRYLAHDAQRTRFTNYWLLSLAGNIGLIVTADIPTFYTCFALMTFSAYGLVLHNQSQDAARAGRVYIAMAVLGEAMILTALLLIAYTGQSIYIREAVPMVAGTATAPWVIVLILFGFGVKTGLLPLHGWLPLAHPVAPTPASAVLSGSMIKAGLLGWMLFLPGGEGSYPVFGGMMIAIGLCGAFYGVVAGLFQSNPKTNLAYSSISQMGIMTVCLGIGLSEAADWTAALLIASIYALNHAFAKGALFMGVGVVLAEPNEPRVQRRFIFTGLALAALAIAGAPMTGGALAKRALKYFAPAEHPIWGPTLEWLLPLSAVATTLLLVRLIYLLYRTVNAPHRQPDDHPGLLPAWTASLFAVAFMAWLTIQHLQLAVSTAPFTIEDWIKSGLPILLGIAVASVFGLRIRLRRTVMPAGDIVIPFERAAHAIARSWHRYIAGPLEQQSGSLDPVLRYLMPTGNRPDRIFNTERAIRRFEWSSASFIVLMLLLILSLWLGAQ